MWPYVFPKKCLIRTYGQAWVHPCIYTYTVIPQQAEVAQGVPCRLRPRIFLTFGTTRVVGRQPYAPAAFTPGQIPGTHFQRLSRPQGSWFRRGEPRTKSTVTPAGIDPGTVLLVARCLNHYATPGTYIYVYIYIYTYIYIRCPRRNVRDFGRVFLMLSYTDITQNTYIQSWTVTEIMAIEKCGLLGCSRTVRRPWSHTRPVRMPDNQTPLASIVMQWPWRDNGTAEACVNYLET